MPEERKFGGSGITFELFAWINSNITVGKTILELGAGNVSTKYLSEKYRLFSIEDKIEYIGKYNSTYIHAPIDAKNNWYHVDALRSKLPADYDCILVDGPVGEGNRQGFVTNIDLFRTDIPIIIDDTWREGERKLLISLSEKLKKNYILFDSFGVLQ